MNLHVRGKAIGLDCGNCGLPFLSHAHGDHLNGVKKSTHLIASRETLDLASLSASIATHPGTELLDAGHILGSRQLWAETDGGSALYTGDFRLKEGIFSKGAESKEAEKLIIECTYGDPFFSFSSPEEVYSDIAKWVNSHKDSILLLGAYNLGKTQELIKALNEYCKITPVVTPHSEHFNRVYEKNGIKLDRVVVGTEEAEEVMRGPFVSIVPPKLARKTFASKLGGAFSRKAYSAFVSGWVQKYNHSAHEGFALSDHADFADILQYVEQVNPKEVTFVHGDGAHLAKVLQKKGIKTSLSGTIPAQTLQEMEIVAPESKS
jgi:putative mRNA 3-end processing factor